jgi:YesN/AraC family two-component response regulator
MDKFEKGKFDVVMTDQAMPQMNGDQLAEEIKKRSPDQPIVMLTGFGPGAGNVEGKSPHVDVVMGKPVNIEELRDALAEAVGEKKA